MRLLILRFSAMGDVALIVPVLGALARSHPKVRMTVVTRKEYEPFFFNIPGAEVIGINLSDAQYQGIGGIYRLYRELQRLGPFDFLIDLHGSLRSRMLRMFFRHSMPIASIVKGRVEKRLQTRRRNKILTPLPHAVDRYMHVFERAGLKAVPGPGPWITPETTARRQTRDFLVKHGLARKEGKWIGIAPFAGHGPKTWPFEHIRNLVRLIDYHIPSRIFLFGGGEKETSLLNGLAELAPQKCIVVAGGGLGLAGELGLMDRLDVMIAMDSFNMHAAALLGRPVLSIWGATHPCSGFGPYGQGDSAVLQIPPEILDCRPCSIFGSKPCLRHDLACLNWIEATDAFASLCETLRIDTPVAIRERRTVLTLHTRNSGPAVST